MTKSVNERARAGADLRYSIAESSLGPALVARSELGVCAVLLGDEPGELLRDLRRRHPDATLTEDGDDLRTLAAGVAGLVESPARGLDAPLDLRGTEFQRTVWQALREIPPGATATYAEIARRIGRPRSVRAVARACAANALAVVVPCHRVVRSDGGASGYRWGAHRRRALLEREAAR